MDVIKLYAEGDESGVATQERVISEVSIFMEDAIRRDKEYNSTKQRGNSTHSITLGSCFVRSEHLETARKSAGTDEDIIFITHER